MSSISGDSQRHGAIGVLLDEEFRFLVIRRSEAVRAPGRLCFPGGGVEAGETQEEAVVRELQEELAIQVIPVRKVWENETASGVKLHWWRVEMLPDQQPEPNPDEVADYAWMTREALKTEPTTLATNLAFLAALERGEFKL